MVDNTKVAIYDFAVDNLYLRFGETVRIEREKLRLSQQLVAERAYMRRATVASIEAGRQSVALHQAIALCDVLGMDLALFIAGLRPDAVGVEALEAQLVPHDLQIVRDLQEGLSP